MEIKLLLDEKYLKVTEALIKAAKKEVYVIAYLLSLPVVMKKRQGADLYEEIVKAAERGCDCRILLNYTTPPNKVIEQNILAGKWLAYHGIECRYLARNRTVHAKMIIIDGVTLIVGSHNWSQRSMERNVEASVEVKEKPIVKEAKDWFLGMWKNSPFVA